MSSPDSEGLRGCLKPKLLLWGSRDTVAPLSEFLRLAEEIPEPKQHEVISGADHFWWGYEVEVAGRVAAFYTEAF